MFRFLVLCLCLLLPLTASQKQLCVIYSEDDRDAEKTLPWFLDQNFSEQFNINYVRLPSTAETSSKGDFFSPKTDLIILVLNDLTIKGLESSPILRHLARHQSLIVLKGGTREQQNNPKWKKFNKILGTKSRLKILPSANSQIKLLSGNTNHTLFTGLSSFKSNSPLQKTDLTKNSRIVLTAGDSKNQMQAVAWYRPTHYGGKVICTTLGNKEDFYEDNFRRFLFNSIRWLSGLKSRQTLKYQFFKQRQENDFPFMFTELFISKAGKSFPVNNKTPRGLLLKAGNNYYSCFDTELLRHSFIWRTPFSALNLIPPSVLPNSKTISPWSTPNMQSVAVMALNQIPGIEQGQALLEDTRTAPSGPLPTGKGRWNGLFLTEEQPVLSYTIGDTEIFETVSSVKKGDITALERNIKCINIPQKLFFHLGKYEDSAVITEKRFVYIRKGTGNIVAIRAITDDNSCFFVNKGLQRIYLEIGEGVQSHVSLLIWEGPEKMLATFKKLKYTPKRFPDPYNSPSPLWPHKEPVQLLSETGKNSSTRLPIPLPNMYQCNISPLDIAFFSSDKAAISTEEGDIWIVSGLQSVDKQIVWQRFASGLYYPQSLVIKNSRIYVLDRTGIIRLHDRDQNGEADFYENFYQFTTAHVSRYSTLKLLKDGSFVISLRDWYNQMRPLADNISVRVTADGQSSEQLALSQKGFYGHNYTYRMDTFKKDLDLLPLYLSSHTSEEANRVYNIPHFLASGKIQPLALPPGMNSPLNGKILWVNKTGISVLYQNTQKPQTVSIVFQYDFFKDPVNLVRANPFNQSIYSLNVSQKTKKSINITPITNHKALRLPQNIEVSDKGIKLSFGVKIHPQSVTLKKFTLSKWDQRKETNIRDFEMIKTVSLSKDAKEIFIETQNTAQTSPLFLSWQLTTEDGSLMVNDAYIFDQRP